MQRDDKSMRHMSESRLPNIFHRDYAFVQGLRISSCSCVQPSGLISCKISGGKFFQDMADIFDSALAPIASLFRLAFLCHDYFIISIIKRFSS